MFSSSSSNSNTPLWTQFLMNPSHHYMNLGPYDIIEMKVTSLHRIPKCIEQCRIIGVAAGESLHNIYRIVMTSLNQKEDRARLVLHVWILPTGELYGTGPHYGHLCKTRMNNDRDIYLNHLPLHIGYRMELVFGKCVYEVVIEDIITGGLTDEYDLLWVPRVCDGSYGESIPFDLCYTPSLFYVPSKTTEDLADREMLEAVASKAATAAAALFDMLTQDTEMNENDQNEKEEETLSISSEKISHLRPLRDGNFYLTGEELDEINGTLNKMRFIRQHSDIKIPSRKSRPEDIIRDEEQRRRYFRLPPRRFFFLLWKAELRMTSEGLHLPFVPNTSTLIPTLSCSQSSTTTASSQSPVDRQGSHQLLVNEETESTSSPHGRTTDRNLSLDYDDNDGAPEHSTKRQRTSFPSSAISIIPSVANYQYFDYGQYMDYGLSSANPKCLMRFPRCRVSKRPPVASTSSSDDSDSSIDSPECSPRDNKQHDKNLRSKKIKNNEEPSVKAVIFQSLSLEGDMSSSHRRCISPISNSLFLSPTVNFNNDHEEHKKGCQNRIPLLYNTTTPSPIEYETHHSDLSSKTEYSDFFS